MKLIHYIITASIILNVALFIYAKPFATRSRPPVVSVKTQARKPDAQDGSAINLKTISPELLMQKLTAMGFPPDVIKTIVSGRIGKIFQDKYYSAYGYDDPRYWRRPQYGQAARAKYSEANRERIEMLDKLFGADNKSAPDTEYLRRGYGDMSDEKLRAIADIDDTFRKKYAPYRKWRDKTGGPVTPEQAKMWNALVGERRDALAKTLTPGELLEYDMRNSHAAGTIQYETRMFDITEQEYRDMFAVYFKVSDGYDVPDWFRQFRSQKERDDYKKEHLLEALGAERYADYMQAKNGAEESLNILVYRLDLPLSAAREVVSVKDDIKKRAVGIDTDATLTNAERAEHYKSLAQEARERITQTLGERGYTAYRDSSKNWIQSLEAGRTPTLPRN
jgi:hypothetical protein